MQQRIAHHAMPFLHARDVTQTRCDRAVTGSDLVQAESLTMGVACITLLRMLIYVDDDTTGGTG
jgi:hypothetical protein